MTKTMKVPVVVFMILCGLAGWGISDIVFDIIALAGKLTR